MFAAPALAVKRSGAKRPGPGRADVAHNPRRAAGACLRACGLTAERS